MSGGVYTYHGHRNSEQELMKGIKPELGKGISESKRDKPKELAVEVPRATQGLPAGADVPGVRAGTHQRVHPAKVAQSASRGCAAVCD